MVGWFQEEGLIADAPPVVAAMEHAGNPHYLPAASGSRSIGSDELVLLDLWGKLREARRRLRRYHLGGVHGSRVPDGVRPRVRRHCPRA